MKKYFVLLLCLGGAFLAHTWANYDALLVSSIRYDKETCTLQLIRNIGGHHEDTYSYTVRGPVIIKIPIQTASISGGGALSGSASAVTFQEYTVPTCNDTCSLGASPISTIAAFSITGKKDAKGNFTSPYTFTIPGLVRDIYVIGRSEVPACLRCLEGQYWCPAVNTCINSGATCTDNQCIDNGVCDINEGCGCGDCSEKQDHCAAGLVCNHVASNPDTSSCVKKECTVGQYFCPSSQTCIAKGETCTDNQCIDNGVCDINEGCGCADCNGEQDHCAATLICKHDATNSNNSECTPTTCVAGTYWCSNTKTCVNNGLPCSGVCRTPLVLHDGQCLPDGPCLPGNKCCGIGTSFCSAQSRCLPAGQACEICTAE